jgi:hypothetical protein
MADAQDDEVQEVKPHFLFCVIPVVTSKEWDKSYPIHFTSIKSNYVTPTTAPQSSPLVRHRQNG